MTTLKVTALNSLGEAIADDVESIAVLHDREITPEVINALKAIGFPNNLGLLPDGNFSFDTWAMMAASVEQLPLTSEQQALDNLAAEYAAVYLTGAYGASPCESAWTDNEHLVCQGSMFEVRELLLAAGLAARNWRQRPDDHLVVQLLFLAHLARTAMNSTDWRHIGKYLDDHLLRWLPGFAARIAQRGEQAFYVALAALTAAWCEQLRNIIARELGEPRPTQKELDDRHKQEELPSPESLAFIPGAAPGW